MKIDLVYLAYNRKRFTEESLIALTANTNWDLVSRVIAYDDGSTDGTRELLDAWRRKLHVPAELRDTRLGSPIATMKHFLSDKDGADYFCKIDSDVMLPAGWLDASIGTLLRSPHLSLLGLEPTWSRTHNPARPDRALNRILDFEEINGNELGFVKCDAIGGVGFMHRSCFYGQRNPMTPYAIYGGFTTWQMEHPEVSKGWIAPALKVFLLDRLPIEPWLSLSWEYVEKKWQRPWTNYRLEDKALWSWWKAV